MRKKQQQGLSLIEVVVTLFIMSVGFLGLASLQSTAIKNGLDVAKRSQVTWLVTGLAERLRANTGGGLAAYPLSLDASSCETEVTASPQCNNTYGNTAEACSAAQMARKDVIDVFCGHAPDLLNLTQVVITCDSACGVNSNYTVAISFHSQSVASSKTLHYRGSAGNHLQRTIAMTVRP